MPDQVAVFSAAAYLCSAAEELRRAGYVALAEEIGHLVAYLDPDLTPSTDESAPIAIDLGIVRSPSAGSSPGRMDPTNPQ